MRKIYWVVFTLMLFPKTGFAQKNAALDSLHLYKRLADEKVNSGEWLAATNFYVRAQRFAESLGDSAALCGIQCGFAKLATNSEEVDNLRRATQLAEQYCLACRDTFQLARVSMLYGILFYKTGQMDSSVLAFEQASARFLTQKDSVRAATALAKVGNVLEGQGKYREALDYYLKYYAVPQVQADDFARMNANIWLAGNYVYLNRGAEAMPFVMEARRLAQKLKGKFEYGVTLEHEALALSKMNQPEKAFAVMEHYAKYYRDTLIPSEQVAQMENLKTQYETEKKEAQIALQTAELNNQKRTIWGIASILALVLVGGFFLFRLNQKLNKRNREKEFLIKEIHHRVKNNLQVLSSLLHLQSRNIHDEAALDAVREGQNRVDAMGLIHQKLYMGENLATVEMPDFLKELGDTLLDSFGMDERVAVKLSVEPLRLDVDTAIPLGLIINELLTNSLKYAFPDGRTGEVGIKLWTDENRKLCLQVSDDGAGKSAPPDAKNSTGFGSKLVQILSQKLKGKPEILSNETGYSTLIRFENFKIVP